MWKQFKYNRVIKGQELKLQDQKLTNIPLVKACFTLRPESLKFIDNYRKKKIVLE